MASGMPPQGPGDIVTTIKDGYDWTVSAKKLVKHALLTLGSVAVYAVLQWAMSTDNVKTLLGDSPLALLAIPLVSGIAGAATNFMKHRNDVPVAVSVMPLDLK